MTWPRATMRIQFHAGFTFADALEIVDYLADLGVSHLYASPILAARAGSMHGYDVIDPTRINPELGGEDGFRALAAALRASGLGLILDIVPNHMAVGGADNAWWLDVLEHGQASRYATFFDIDWRADDPALSGKLLAPFLGKPYGEALAAGEIRLGANPLTGRPAALYFDHVFPIRPEDADALGADALAAFDPASEDGRSRLHALLERQHFRLAWWRSAADEINWRRFFDVCDLAALRIEDDATFEAAHATPLRLYREGLVDGFRIDHVDGLTDPAAYCRKLRRRLTELQQERPRDLPSQPAYLIVEKILARGETLPLDWLADGATGYEFMNEASALLHAAEGERPLGELWRRISGRPAEFDVEEQMARREILLRSFAGQFAALAQAVHRQFRQDLDKRDWGEASIRRALAEILTQLRVYRTYANGGGQALSEAVARAVARGHAADRPLISIVGAALAESDERDEHRARLLAHFRHLSAPLAAKAVEDTAFYRSGRILSRADVGFDPDRFADSPASFHEFMAARRRDYPRALLATATHDHKRGEDMRARLAVLSEAPSEWAAAVEAALHAEPLDRPPAPGDRYILFQTIVGAWPPLLDLRDDEGCETFAERLRSWQEKALRERKLETSWQAPDAEYEKAASDFLARLFADRSPEGALGGLSRLARRIGAAGALNGLSQALLKMTAPGAPDFYQGADDWDFSLVDPDNRRPVDWGRRKKTLADNCNLVSLARTWRDGRVKQALIAAVLGARRERAALFAEGGYAPLRIEGARDDRAIAFARILPGEMAIVAAPRLAYRMLGDLDGLAIEGAAWGEAAIDLSEYALSDEAHDALAGGTLRLGRGRIPLGEIWKSFPVALLIATRGPG